MTKREPSAGTRRNQEPSAGTRRNRELLNELVYWKKIAAETTSGTRRQRIEAKIARLEDEIRVVNLGLVRSIARIYSKGGQNHDDYVQVGGEVLISKFDEWDPERGTLATFLMWDIKKAIKREMLALESPGRRLADFERAPAVTTAATYLRERLGRMPTDAEIASETGFTEAQVQRTRWTPPRSLDTPLGESGDTLADVLPDAPLLPEHAIGALARLDLQGLVDALAPLSSPELEQLEPGTPAYERELANLARVGARSLIVAGRIYGLDGHDPFSSFQALAAWVDGPSHEAYKRAIAISLRWVAAKYGIEIDLDSVADSDGANDEATLPSAGDIVQRQETTDGPCDGGQVEEAEGDKELELA